MKRVTYRITVSVPDSWEKKDAKHKMEEAIARHFDDPDHFVQVMQVDRFDRED